MARITDLKMTALDVIVALADGNPGATEVMFRMLKDNQAIDPDSALGAIGAIMSLDTHRIYGSRIWMLYKDVCGQDIVKTIGVIRAVQLGLVSERVLNAAIDGSEQLDADAVLAQVRERLPKFGRPKAEAA